jgi:hypothetical protein
MEKVAFRRQAAELNESFGERRNSMWDIGCVVASTLFFAIAIGYAMGCDRLGAKETQK